MKKWLRWIEIGWQVFYEALFIGKHGEGYRLRMQVGVPARVFGVKAAYKFPVTCRLVATRNRLLLLPKSLNLSLRYKKFRDRAGLFKFTQEMK